MNASIRRESLSWHKAYRSRALSDHRRKGHLKKLQRLGLLDGDPDKAILDVCCGEGEILDLLSDDGYKSLLGIDLALPQSVKKRSWKYVVGAADQLPFVNDKLDCVLCTHSLHHLGGLEAISRFLTRAYESLREGGTIVLVDHYDSLQLRIAFKLLRSPLAVVSAYSRNFKAQLIEEQDYLYPYLDRWKPLLEILMSGRFGKLKIEQDLFFFYATLTKESRK